MKNVHCNSIWFHRSCRIPRQLLTNVLLSLIITLTTNTQTTFAMGMFDDVSLTTVEIIKNNGYDVEVHDVVTEDGYILELHRIPRSKSGEEPTRNHPVFIHHGILGSSADWVLGGANISLPMQLADAGYDVWLSNCRGNTYSRKHVSMNFKQRAYWDFSLHEVGKYDLPAAFDYILINTKTQQLHYIGYSMGSCVFFIMASERPEYQPKIRSQISLAPVAYLSNTRSSLKYIAPYAKMMNSIFQRMTKGMLLPQSRMQKFLASTVCRERMTQKLICEKCIIFSVCGSDPYHFDSKLVPLIMGHFPAGTAAKLTTHFSQFILKDTFGQYDYGPSLNMKHYNSTCPPLYNLKSIQVPITLIYGENDILADVEDVMRLKNQLPKLLDAFPVNSPYCNHVDFLWSVDVTKLVNDPVRGILETTDDPGWEYTGPNPEMVPPEIGSGDRTETCVSVVPAAVPGSPIPLDGMNFVQSLDYIVDNLDAIIANTMPRTVFENDLPYFERQREMQKILFGDLIDFIKSTEKKYGKIRDDLTNEISDWTDEMATGVAGARNAVETHARRTTVLINGKVALAGKSMASRIAIAENSVVNGVAKAEHFVVDSVVKAEQSVVGGIVKAENFVNYGVNKADRAMSSTLNITLRSLSRAFWFLK